MPGSGLHGVLVVDKPGGMTSAHVVARVRRALGEKSIGHTGTLDPMATGVLPLVIGEGTKIAQFLLADDKQYEGELELGVVTDTLDVEGQVLARRDPAGIDEGAVRAAMGRLTGELSQVPPAYSALKQDGVRAHERARAGLAVELAPRPVRVDRFALSDFAAPRARFVVDCSKGTYVRSLVRDLGEALGCGATLTALRRTRAGRFDLAQAISLEQVGDPASRARVIPPAAALDHLPAWHLSATEAARVAQGQRLPLPPDSSPGQLFRMLAPGGALAALGQVGPDGRLLYLRVFPPVSG
jgi:tRNA pseudouridine55 synthase